MKKIIISLALLAGSATLFTQCSTTTGTAQTAGFGLQAVQFALNGGLNNVVSLFNDPKSFISNALIDAAMPKELKDINKSLTDVGLGSLVDKEKNMIAGVAKSTVSTAEPILKNAINNLTAQDVATIAMGGKGAATKILREKTEAQLVQALTPVVSKQVSQLGLNNVLNNALLGEKGKAITSILGAVAGVKTTGNVSQNIDTYVTQQLTDGIYKVIEDSEAKTRSNPTNILNGILGGQN